MKVAIIGAGWAGLAAAVELSAAGIAPTVFEAGREIGGRARNLALAGHALDNGQHILVGAYRDTLRLMRQVGADPAQQFLRVPLTLHTPGRFHLALPRWPAPWHLAGGLLAARGAGLGEKLAAARFMRRLQADQYRLVSDTTVADLLDRQGQRGALRRYLWEPLCLAALNTPLEQASAQVFANVLRDSLGGSRDATDLLLPRVPLGDLFPRPAASWLAARGARLVTGCRIGPPQSTPAGWTLPGAPGQHFDQVIIATAPRQAIRLLVGRPAQHETLGPLADLAYEPIATVFLGYPPETTLPFPMIGLDGPDGQPIGQWAFDRGPLGGHPGIMACVLSAHGDWERLDNDTLASRLHRELSHTLGRPLPRPRWQRIIREQRATHACRPDLPRPAARTPEPGLWLAGDYVYPDYPATLEAAVRSGIATARGILDQAQPSAARAHPAQVPG